VHAAGPVFSHHDFDPARLAARKEADGLTASLCIPARDEATTIGRIVESARRRLVEAVPLLDEILVVDDHSADATAAVAAAAGARVVRSADVLPEAGPGSGFAGRRAVLEALPIVCGWGVDLALVVDVVARHGLPALAQVDLGTRRHRHRPLHELSPQAMAILTTALRRAGVPEREAARLVRFDAEHQAHEVLVEVRERPPLRSLAGYPPGDELTA